MARDKNLPKPRNPYALLARTRSGAGVHQSKPRYEPTVEEFLDEMEEEKEEQDKVLRDFMNEEDA